MGVGGRFIARDFVPDTDHPTATKSIAQQTRSRSRSAAGRRAAAREDIAALAVDTAVLAAGVWYHSQPADVA